jgi:acetyl-CoA carboxylase biotin carboxyl carrier protein
MDLIYVKKLIKMLSESAVDEIEIEEDGKRIRVVKRGASAGGFVSASQNTANPFAASAPAATPPAAPVPVPASVQSPAPVDTAKYHEIKSPIVGTFYRAPAPDAAAFVQVGSVVGQGTVLCIVEAMKLMNEIECDVSGKVAKILVENGQPVEYDQTLFLVETA